VEVAPALPVVGALCRAALYRAVPPVPARHTQAGPVLALAVQLTPARTPLNHSHSHHFRLISHFPCYFLSPLLTTDLGSHSRLWQRAPVQPASQTQAPFWQVPRWPQSRPHSRMAHSLPAQPASQVQVWVAGSRRPWAEQPGRQWRAAGSGAAHSGPSHPFVQMHEPATQKPRPEHSGSGQSAGGDAGYI
jgi:hypothetical protein